MTVPAATPETSSAAKTTLVAALAAMTPAVAPAATIQVIALVAVIQVTAPAAMTPAVTPAVILAAAPGVTLVEDPGVTLGTAQEAIQVEDPGATRVPAAAPGVHLAAALPAPAVMKLLGPLGVAVLVPEAMRVEAPLLATLMLTPGVMRSPAPEARAPQVTVPGEVLQAIQPAALMSQRTTKSLRKTTQALD
jgi:hypothetical protein